MTARILSGGDTYSYQLGGVLLLMLIDDDAGGAQLPPGAAACHRAQVAQAKELLVQLRIEKQAADAARREAEVANRAKTQFFAAASHDLRQPLHAMGLFAEALRQKSHDEEVAQLVNSINSSVDALEGLFSELLDITRIDTGGVEVHPRHFEVADILRKLRLHFEPTAFEKGLALRLRGGAQGGAGRPAAGRAHPAQPGLQRHPLHQRRHRAGRRAAAWRQGAAAGLGHRPGHPRDRARAHLRRVLPGAQHRCRGEPHQRKGLGLGLAIVKRLADLMNAPLTLASRARPRHRVHAGVAGRQGAACRAVVKVPGKGPLGLTLDGRLIVVVEDEPVVRSGLEVLLKGWGASLASFDSVAQTRAWAEATDPGHSSSPTC